jgi:hypothetical protein
VKSSFRTSAYPLGEFAAFAILLFVVRFMMRGHLVPQLDEECTVGGAAVNLLAQGIRFPLRVYAPNDYENGFFYSALLAATSFSLLGRNVLALKLVTHLVVSLGAAATVWLLRSCLDELRLNDRQVRWTAIAVLVVATAFSPREVALFSTWNVGIGSHAEGPAIDMVLLALFARRRASWSTAGTAAFWVLTGFVLHVNKGSVVLVLVLGVAELSLSRSSPRRLTAVVLGFLLGIAPELLRMASPDAGGGGWATIASKLMDHARDFPSAFVRDVLALADYRSELLATWVLAIGVALALLRVARRRSSIHDSASPPSALGMTLGLLLLHVAGLTIMAQGGIDNYAMHAYPPLAILTAVLTGWLCCAASKSLGVRAGSWTGAMLVGLMVVVHRPERLRLSFEQVSALWGKRGSAACSWRFGEAFLQVQGEPGANYSLLGTPALPERDREAYLLRERHAIELCRSLSEPTQILDCIGGIARELQYGSGRIDGEPPSELSGIERDAYAFYYGVRRAGHIAPCDDFLEPTLRKECRTAVQLDCFVFVDTFSRFESGNPLGRPRCDIPEPPMDGYWADMRLDLLSRPTGSPPKFPPEFGKGSIGECKALVESCY